METDIEKRKRVYAELEDAVRKLEAMNEKLKAFNEANNLKAPPKPAESKSIPVNFSWVIHPLGAGFCGGILYQIIERVFFT